MRKRLLDLLCCPDCRNEFLEISPYVQDDASSILEGEIRCEACGSRFPVINSVPRMLPASLRPYLATFHPEFFARHPELAPTAIADPDDEVARTLEGFSYQHLRLTNRTRETERWRRNFLESVPVGPDFFPGKLGVDLGCGSGRHAFWAQQFGAEVVAVDLSEGVEVARTMLADCPRVHIVQGDIYHLPLKPAAFDFAYSLGVIHHLPDPEAGFQCAVRALRKGGRVCIWVYGLQGMRWWYRLSHMRWLRGITPRLPRWAQHGFSVLLAALLELAIWAPCRALARLPGGPAVVDRVPLGDACQRPFTAKVRSVFDRVQPPVTCYHSAEELSAWLHRGSMTDVAVVNRDGRGWIATGTKR